MNRAFRLLTLLSFGAFGCSSGGQSFDDGSGDLGKRSHSDQRPPLALSELRSLRITSSSASDDTAMANLVFQGSVSFVGDLDADGHADFVVTEPQDTGANAHVFYGRSEFPEQLALQDADFEVSGASAVRQVGDFNGDGFDDFAFVAHKLDPYSSDASLLLGGEQRRSGTIVASTLETVLDVPKRDAHGLLAPGDVNGDGFADLVIATDNGTTQLVFGSANPAWGTANGGPRVTLDVYMPDEKLWRHPAGDLDGDGIADLLAMGAAGGTVLYYGRRDGWDTSSSTMPPDASFNGLLHGFGDWDGDGYADLAQIVSNPLYVMESEELRRTEVRPGVVITYGSAERFNGEVSPPHPPADTTYAMDVVFARGDLDGDHRPDLIVGSPFTSLGPIDSVLASQDPEGAVFYAPAGRAERLDTLRFDARSAAFRGDDGSPEVLGLSVSAGGDANGDGFEDLLIMRKPAPDNPGEVTLIFGGAR